MIESEYSRALLGFLNKSYWKLWNEQIGNQIRNQTGKLPSINILGVQEGNI